MSRWTDENGLIAATGAAEEDISLNALKKFLGLAMAVVLLVMMQPAVYATGNRTTFKKVDETVYATTGVHVRTGPGVQNKSIAILQKGDQVQRIGIGSNGWSKVIYKGREAYVHSAYLKTRTSNESDNFNANLDYSELTRQIAIANGLKETDFTSESWSILNDALVQANDAMSKKDQGLVDIACEALANAVASLEKMDYMALENALRAVRAFSTSNTLNENWTGLLEAAEEGESLLTSGDQAAVDAAAARITELLTALEEALDQQVITEIIVQEVPVEVPPTDDYCNISVHRVWPVLLIISVILNVGLIAVIVVYVARKRKKVTDDIPLVDYDINDDF